MADLLREVLEEVRNGKTSFQPKSDNQEDIVSFQPVAAALKHAKNIGYINAEFRDSHMIGISGCTVIALVTGPLTYSGLQYLEARRQMRHETGTDNIASHNQSGGITAGTVIFGSTQPHQSPLTPRKPAWLRIWLVLAAIVAFFAALVKILEYLNITPWGPHG